MLVPLFILPGAFADDFPPGAPPGYAPGDDAVLGSVTASATYINEDQYAVDSHFGTCIQNTLSKLRSKGGMYDDPIHIVILGDSITAATGGWAYQLETYLGETYGTGNLDIEIYGKSGYGIERMLPLVESACVFPNPDLFILSEYESNDAYRLGIMEMIIQLIRSRTTSDIAIGTWGAQLSSLDTVAHLANWATSDLTDAVNSMRAMAQKYSCEVIDFNDALYRKALSGATMSLYYADDVHPNTLGSTDIYFAEAKKHFNPDYRSYSYANLMCDVEQRYNFNMPNIWPAQNTTMIDLAGGAWVSGKTDTEDNYFEYITSSTNTNYLEIDFEGTGIEFSYPQVQADGATHTLLIDSGAPSAVTVGGYPLEYCTPIELETGADTTRPVDHAIHSARVTDLILDADEVSREFEIAITSVTRDGSDVMTACAYTLDDVDNTITWTGTGDLFADTTFDEPSDTGEIVVPATVGGYLNYADITLTLAAADRFAVGDTYRFLVKPNWADSFSTEFTAGIADDDAVTNGNMETNDPPDDWANNDSSVLAGEADERTGGVGSQSIKCTAGVSSIVAIQNTTADSGTLTAGQRYLLSGWLKNGDATSLSLRAKSGNQSSDYGLSDAVAATAWTYNAMEFTATDEGYYIYLYMLGGAGKIGLFDDIAIRPIVLTNGNFEEGDPPDSWAANGGSTLSSVADERTGGAGTQCLSVIFGTNQTVAIQGTSTGGLTVGKKYRISGWLKNVDATSVYLYGKSGDQTTNYGVSEAVTSTSWTYNRLEFTATDVGYRVYLRVEGTAGQEGRFDDIVLDEIDEITGEVRRVAILGLDNEPHTLRITKSNTEETKLTDFRIFNPPYARKSE